MHCTQKIPALEYTPTQPSYLKEQPAFGGCKKVPAGLELAAPLPAAGQLCSPGHPLNSSHANIHMHFLEAFTLPDLLCQLL